MPKRFIPKWSARARAAPHKVLKDKNVTTVEGERMIACKSSDRAPLLYRIVTHFVWVHPG